MKIDESYFSGVETEDVTDSIDNIETGVYDSTGWFSLLISAKNEYDDVLYRKVYRFVFMFQNVLGIEEVVMPDKKEFIPENAKYSKLIIKIHFKVERNVNFRHIQKISKFIFDSVDNFDVMRYYELMDKKTGISSRYYLYIQDGRYDMRKNGFFKWMASFLMYYETSGKNPGLLDGLTAMKADPWILRYCIQRSMELFSSRLSRVSKMFPLKKAPQSFVDMFKNLNLGVGKVVIGRNTFLWRVT